MIFSVEEYSHNMSQMSRIKMLESLPVSDLESQEEADSLHAVVAAVHVVPHEEVVGVRGLATDAEQLHQVVELTMNIPADCYWTFHLENFYI